MEKDQEPMVSELQDFDVGSCIHHTREERLLISNLCAYFALQIVMEFMERGSLYDILQNRTRCLDAEVIKSIIKDVVDGVSFLHAAEPGKYDFYAVYQSFVSSPSSIARCNSFLTYFKQQLFTVI